MASLYDDFKKEKGTPAPKATVAKPTGGLSSQFDTERAQRSAPVVPTSVTSALDSISVPEPVGAITFDASRSARDKVAESLRSVETVIRAPKAGEVTTPEKPTLGTKVGDFARKILPSKLEDLFGLKPKSDTAKRVEAWGDLTLNYDRMKELDDTVRAVATEKYPDGKVPAKKDYKEPEGFWGQFAEGFTQAYIGTVKPVIGTMVENAGASPESVAWGKKQGDRAVAELILRPELNAPKDLPDFFDGGVADRRWWGRAIGGSIPSIASALASATAVALVTKNPGAASSAAWGSSFAMEKANHYRDMLDKGVAPDKANSASTIYGAISATLELGMGVNPGALATKAVIGGGASKELVDAFLKYTASTLVKAPARLLTNAVQEGNEEAIQQFTQNLITGFLYSPQGLTEGVAESWAQGFAGGLPLGGANVVVTDFKKEGGGAQEPPPNVEAEIKKEAADALKRNHSANAVEREIKKEFGITASQADRLVKEAAEEADIKLPSFLETNEEDDVLKQVQEAAKVVSGKSIDAFKENPSIESLKKVAEGYDDFADFRTDALNEIGDNSLVTKIMEDAGFINVKEIYDAVHPPTDVAEILGELSDSAEATDDWHFNYADDFAKLSNKLDTIEKAFKAEKNKEKKAKLQETASDLSDQMGRMENEFIAKYEEKAKQISRENSAKEQARKTAEAIEKGETAPTSDLGALLATVDEGGRTMEGESDYQDTRRAFHSAFEALGIDAGLDALGFPKERDAIYYNINSGRTATLEELISEDAGGRRMRGQNDAEQLALSLENWRPQKGDTNPVIEATKAQTEETIREELADRFEPYIKRNKTVEAFSADVSSQGGTMTHGSYDVVSAKKHIKVTLNDGRVFTFPLRDIYKMRASDTIEGDEDNDSTRGVRQRPRSPRGKDGNDGQAGSGSSDNELGGEVSRGEDSTSGAGARERLGAPVAEQKTAIGKVIVELFAVAGEELTDLEASFTIKSEGFEDLHIERIGDQLSMMHTFLQNGDVMRDPDVVFDIIDGQFVASTFEQSPFPIRNINPSDPFLNTWARNIRGQGFLGLEKKKPASRNLMMPDTFTSTEEPQGESHVPVKDVFAKEYHRYFSEVLQELGAGWTVDEGYATPKGALSAKKVFNPAGPGVTGDAHVIFWKEGSQYGIYLSGSGTMENREKIEVGPLMYRATRKDIKYRGFANNYIETTKTSPFLLAQKIRETVDFQEAQEERTPETRTKEMVVEGKQKREAIGTSTDEIQSIVDATTDIVDGEAVLKVRNITEEELEKVNSYTGAGGREKEGAEGRGLLDEYYTPGDVTTMVSAALANLDAVKKGMSILEPSAGIGAFISDLDTEGSKIDAFEINETAARILKLNYPSVAVRVAPFEELFITDRGAKKPITKFYDLVVGNPPYGEHRGKYKGLGEEPKISRYEEYFLKRALDLTSDGGHVAMVVPSGFVRGGTSYSKEQIVKLGDLVAAYRLPNGAFPTTDIGTDILVFKKSTSLDGAINAERIRKITNDEYFTDDHPEHVLGENTTRIGRYGVEDAVFGTLESAVDQFYKLNGSDFAQEQSINDEAQAGIVEDISESYKPEVYKEVKTKGKKIAWKKLLAGDTRIAILEDSYGNENWQIKGPMPAEFKAEAEKSGKVLNERKEYNLGTVPNVPKSGSLLVAEMKSEEGKMVFLKAEDDTMVAVDANLLDNVRRILPDADIFLTERMKAIRFEQNGELVGVLMPMQTVDIVLEEASKKMPKVEDKRAPAEKNKTAVTKTGHSAKLLDLAQYSTATPEEAELWKYVQPTGELEGNFKKENAFYYRGQYYNSFNYLQGDIYEKLDQLEDDKSAISAEQYAKQKKALQDVLPERVDIDRVNITPNSRFANELELPSEHLIDGATQPLAEHFLDWIKELPYSAFGESSSYAIRGYVNNQAVRGGDKLQNEQERRTRRLEGDRLFKLFLRENLAVESQKVVVDKYNRQFNAYVRPDYRNVPLVGKLNSTFKGKDLDIRDVQLQGVGFLVNRGVGLLAHDVGVGKTMQSIIAVNEVLARGWAKRPLIVAPNPNVYTQWIKEITELLPDVRINLLANLGGDFKGDLKTLEIPEGSISIITEEGFKRLGFSNETYANLTRDFLDVIEDPNEDVTKRRKELNKAHAEADIAKGIKGTSGDRFFEDLGFDHITVDEVHNANHIVARAKMDKEGQTSEFRGFNVKPSQFGIKVWLAAQYIQKQNNGRNVQMASATPFTNNPLEYYSVLSLMARERMNRMGILNVNDFMTMFMEISTQHEFKADGTYIEKSEVRSFKNYQQFQKLLTEFIDFRDGVEAGVKRPDRVSREYVVGETEEAVKYKEMAQELFADKKHAGALKAIGELRAVAFSPYLSRYYAGKAPTAKEFVENSPKIKAMVEIIKQSLKDNPTGGHLIYSPVGVEYFPLVKEALLDATGLKSSQIDIISGATPKPKRGSIQEGFNAGKILIVLGSDAIQEGVNLQENTTDLHILSLPWNFTQVRQVIGRAWRQGNKYPRVRVNTYFTENSVDVFLSQKLQNKEKRYEESLRFKGDDLDVGDINFEEMKLDLITDPVRRTELEYQFKENELEYEIKRKLADEGYKNRRAAELIQAQDKVRVYTEHVEENHYEWAKKDLVRAQEHLVEVRTKLAERGINIADIESDIAGAKAEVDALRARIEDLKKEKEGAIEQAKGERILGLGVRETDYSGFVRARAEENQTFYGEGPKAKISGTLTTRLLNKLADHVDVSKQFIQDLTNSADLKQVERDLIRYVLESEGVKVNVEAFKERVQAELLPLEIAAEMDSGETALYENITLSNDIRGPIGHYFERVYQSPIRTSADAVHFSGIAGIDGYFAHTRIEDLPSKDKDEGDTRRVIEVQSDLFQKGRLEGETITRFEVNAEEALEAFKKGEKVYHLSYNPMSGENELGDLVSAAEEIDEIKEYGIGDSERAQELVKLEPYRNTWWERIVREEVKSAAKDRKTVLLFPVGETAMKIEGLGRSDVFRLGPAGTDVARKTVTPDMLKIGLEVHEGGQNVHSYSWIITDVLGDGKFKAVRKSVWDDVHSTQMSDEVRAENLKNNTSAETFDISGNVDTANPIYRFYEKDVSRYLRNQYNATLVTDPQGVKWMSVSVTPEMATDPVVAYRAVQSNDEAWAYAKESLLTDTEKGAIEEYTKLIALDRDVPSEVMINMKSGYGKYLDYTAESRKLLRSAQRDGSPFDITKEEGERALRTMFDEHELDILYRENKAIGFNENGAWGLYMPSRAYSHPFIKLVTTEGKVQSQTVYHEAFHAYMDRFVSKEEKADLFARVEKNIATAPSRLYLRTKYNKEEVTEEWLADDFADYVAGKSYLQENKSFYQKLLTKIREWIRKVAKLDRIYDAILKKERVPGGLPMIQSEAEDTPSELDEPGDALVRAKLRTIGWGGFFSKDLAENRKEGMEAVAKAAMETDEVNRDLIRKDINHLENLTAQARDLYLKDPNEFEAADAFEKAADARRLKKASLDKYFSTMMKPYYDLKGGSLEKVNKVLMQGDLEGKEYSEAELRTMNLSADEITAYKAIRKAFNTAHQFLIVEMRKNGVPEDEIKDFERERVAYMPHKWKYRYVVKHQVRKKVNGSWHTYQMDNFKSERQAREVFEEMKKKNTRDDVRYSLDTLDSLEVDFFSEQRLSYDSLRSAIVQAKTPQDVKDMMIEALRNMVKEKGFGRQYMRRTGTRGYEQKEVPKIIADYFSGMNGYITKMEAGKRYYQVLSSIDARRQSKFYGWMRDMIAYDMGNTKEWQLARSLAFIWYLANDISFLLTNATQNFTVGTGELSKYMTPAQKILGPESMIIKAMTDWSIGNVSPEENKVVNDLIELGELGGEMASELMGFKNNPLYTEISSGFSKVMYKSTSFVEQNVNRVPAFIAARRLFIDQGLDESQANTKALEVSNDIHFRYGKQNRPRFERGKVGTLFVFYHYMRSLMFQLYRDASKQEYAAFARKMLYTTILGGAVSLPFAKTLLMIFQAIFGNGCNLDEDEDCKMAAEMHGWELAITKGVPALTGVDLSGRVGIDIMSVQSIMEDPNDVKSYIGAFGNLVWVNPKNADEGGRLQQGVELLRQGRIDDALGKLAPDMFGGLFKSYAGYRWGVRSFAGTPLEDASGDVFKYNAWEAIIRATGFTPTRENIAWEAKSKKFEAEEERTKERSLLRRTIQASVQRGEIDEARALQEKAVAEGIIDESTNYIKEFGKNSFIKDALDEWENGEKTSATLSALEDELVTTLFDGKATDIQKYNVRKEFAVYRTFGLRDPLVEEITKSDSNKEKVEVLLNAREEMGAEAFTEFVKKGRKKIKTEAGNEGHILISDELLEDYKKARKKALLDPDV